MAQIFRAKAAHINHIDEDSRTLLQRMRLREVRAVLVAAKIEFDPYVGKDVLIALANSKGLTAETAPQAEGPIEGREPTIHELRKQAFGLTKDEGKWQWNDIVKLSKDELKAVLRGDYTP